MHPIKKKIIRFLLKSRTKTFYKRENRILKYVNSSSNSKLFKFGKKNSKKIFYVIKRQPGGGLFSNLLYVLNQLIVAEKKKMIPIVDMENFTNYYNEKKKINSTYNSWLYYFSQVSKYKLNDTYNSKRVKFSFEKHTHSTSNNYKKNEKNLKKIYKKYIKIKDEHINEARKFVYRNKINKKTLGIHWRGSDHKVLPSHPFPPTKKQILKLTRKIMKKGKFEKIFLVTEEKNYLEIFKRNFGKKVKFYNSFRSDNRKDFNYCKRKNHRYKLGKESLIEVLILSKLNTLICSRSNISEVAKFISDNKNYTIHEIMNGFNSSKIIKSLYLWKIKSMLPPFFGGFKNIK